MSRTDDWAAHLDPAEEAPELPPAHREALDRFAAVLADESMWRDPPPGLRAAILDQADTERPAMAVIPDAAPIAAAPVTPLPPPEEIGRRAARTRQRRRPRRRLALAGGLLTAAAAAVLVVVLAWLRPQVTTIAMQGTPAAPTAQATADLEPRPAGLAITLHVKGLAPAPPGTYYAAWLRGPGGVVPVGTFHWRKGGIPIELWSGVLSDDYPDLFVTLQREGSPPTPSNDVVLTGKVR